MPVFQAPCDGHHKIMETATHAPERVKAALDLTAVKLRYEENPLHKRKDMVGALSASGVSLEFEGRDAVSKKQGEALLEPINVKVRAANHGQVRQKWSFSKSVTPPSRFSNRQNSGSSAGR
jgi:hypothetical protein